MADRALPYRSALVVANPIAGRGRGRSQAEELARALEERGVHTELSLTRAKGDATRTVADHGDRPDVVVAIGGDGTIGEVLAGLPANVPLAVLPMGTANVLARDLGLPRDPAGVLDTLEAGRSTRLDVASVNGELSFLVTGIGVDGTVVRDIEQRRRGPITMWTYVGAILRSLSRYSAPALTVEVDGERLPGEYAWVLVSNMIRYGGFMRLWPDRVLDDGKFEVFLFPRGSRTALLGYALRSIVRGLPGGSCRMLQARRVRVDSRAPAPYEVDGDFGGETPVEIEVKSEQRRLLLPPI